jgi:hypothetical protein
MSTLYKLLFKPLTFLLLLGIAVDVVRIWCKASNTEAYYDATVVKCNVFETSLRVDLWSYISKVNLSFFVQYLETFDFLIVP